MLLDVFDRCPVAECYNETDPAAFDNYVLRAPATLATLIRRAPGRAVVFKSICDSQNAAVLLDRHDRARALWIYRRYPDVVNSALRNFSEHNRYLHYMLHDPVVARWRLENVDAYCLQLVRKFHTRGISEASARALIWYLRNYQFFQQRLDRDPRVTLVSYEKLVLDPNAVLRPVFAALELPYEPRWAKPLFRSSIGRNPAPRIDAAVSRLCDELFHYLDDALAAQEGTTPADPANYSKVTSPVTTSTSTKPALVGNT